MSLGPAERRATSDRSHSNRSTAVGRVDCSGLDMRIVYLLQTTATKRARLSCNEIREHSFNPEGSVVTWQHSRRSPFPMKVERFVPATTPLLIGKPGRSKLGCMWRKGSSASEDRDGKKLN